MLRVRESSGRQQFRSSKTPTVLLLLIFGAWVELALAETAPPARQQLTLTGAVDLALKQNLDLQVANIETATRQQERVIARSELLPQADIGADDSVTLHK